MGEILGTKNLAKIGLSWNTFVPENLLQSISLCYFVSKIFRHNTDATISNANSDYVSKSPKITVPYNFARAGFAIYALIVI